MSTDTAIDTTADELPTEDSTPAPVQAALVRRERRSEVIRPLNADDLVESFAAYQELLPKLLTESDYQSAEAGKRFVKKSGWRKIATAFDLDVQLVAEEVERDPDTGRILRAKTTMRATAPSGRVMDGDGYCTIEEFKGRRATNPKLENDLRGTAATRAKNRAISDLVGMGEVSAEEVDAGHHEAGPPHGPAVADPERVAASAALTEILGDVELARAAWVQIKEKCGGYMPHAVAVALLVVAPQTGPDPTAAG